MTGSIYVHTNKANGKVYVGQTWQEPEARWTDQRNSARRTKIGGCRYLDSALRKYGWDNFDHQIAATASTPEELDNLEKLWIILLRSTDPQYGYNLRSGGRGGFPVEETRQRMSAVAKTRKRRPCSEETKAKISAAQLGISKPATQKHIDAHKNSPKVLANCRRLAAENKGKPWSDARRAAHKPRKAWNSGIKTGKPSWNRGIKMPSVSEKMKGNTRGKGKTMSSEHKEKLRRLMINREISEGTRNKMKTSHIGLPWSAARRAAYERSK